jgi:thymidylate synthase
MNSVNQRKNTMKTAEDQYLDIMAEILEEGIVQKDRTGTGTREIWGPTIRCHMADGFPILTSKKVIYSKVVSELCWMIRGGDNVNQLHAIDPDNHIWDDWAGDTGDLGPVYGAQWRKWGMKKTIFSTPDGSPLYERGIDQLAEAVELIKTNPTCRRIIVTAWNPSDLPFMKLPPCHLYFQFNVQNDQLNIMAVQRSADWFIGVPFNIAQYATLLHIVAHLTGLEPGILQMQFGSAHLYLNHLDQAREQLKRGPLAACKPSLSLSPWLDHLDRIKPEHIRLYHYQHRGFISAPISV